MGIISFFLDRSGLPLFRIPAIIAVWGKPSSLGYIPDRWQVQIAEKMGVPAGVDGLWLDGGCRDFSSDLERTRHSFRLTTGAGTIYTSIKRLTGC
jgi:hypothetical protein